MKLKKKRTSIHRLTERVQ